MTEAEKFAEIRNEFIVEMANKCYAYIVNAIRFNETRVETYKRISAEKPIGKVRYIIETYGYANTDDLFNKEIKAKVATLDWLPAKPERVCNSIEYSVLEMIADRLDKELAGELNPESDVESGDESDVESDVESNEEFDNKFNHKFGVNL